MLSGRPVVFGEVLFDQFEDGAVLGGAPFNVAWHLQGFGEMPLFISRVGTDVLGEQVLEEMRVWGMDTTGIQQDQQYPTGVVQVIIKRGQPHYEILAGQAYDYIKTEAVLQAVNGLSVSLLYHGTLVSRSSVSANTLRIVKDAINGAFIDVNLRAPWWEMAAVEQLLSGARWLKLNEVEMNIVAECIPESADEMRQAALRLLLKYGLELLILTLGEKGACLFRADDAVCLAPVPVDSVVDTVGAGDAFSAVTILGLAKGWPDELMLERALTFAAEICRVRGATVRDKMFYSEFVRRWAL